MAWYSKLTRWQKTLRFSRKHAKKAVFNAIWERFLLVESSLIMFDDLLGKLRVQRLPLGSFNARCLFARLSAFWLNYELDIFWRLFQSAYSLQAFLDNWTALKPCNLPYRTEPTNTEPTKLAELNLQTEPNWTEYTEARHNRTKEPISGFWSMLHKTQHNVAKLSFYFYANLHYI